MSASSRIDEGQDNRLAHGCCRTDERPAPPAPESRPNRRRKRWPRRPAGRRARRLPPRGSCRPCRRNCHFRSRDRSSRRAATRWRVVDTARHGDCGVCRLAVPAAERWPCSWRCSCRSTGSRPSAAAGSLAVGAARDGCGSFGGICWRPPRARRAAGGGRRALRPSCRTSSNRRSRLLRGETRLLMADEVGLGKTVQAGADPGRDLRARAGCPVPGDRARRASARSGLANCATGSACPRASSIGLALRKLCLPLAARQPRVGSAAACGHVVRLREAARGAAGPGAPPVGRAGRGRGAHGVAGAGARRRRRRSGRPPRRVVLLTATPTPSDTDGFRALCATGTLAGETRHRDVPARPRGTRPLAASPHAPPSRPAGSPAERRLHTRARPIHGGRVERNGQRPSARRPDARLAMIVLAQARRIGPRGAPRLALAAACAPRGVPRVDTISPTACCRSNPTDDSDPADEEPDACSRLRRDFETPMPSGARAALQAGRTRTRRRARPRRSSARLARLLRRAREPASSSPSTATRWLASRRGCTCSPRRAAPRRPGPGGTAGGDSRVHDGQTPGPAGDRRCRARPQPAGPLPAGRERRAAVDTVPPRAACRPGGPDRPAPAGPRHPPRRARHVRGTRARAPGRSYGARARRVRPHRRSSRAPAPRGDGGGEDDLRRRAVRGRAE